MRHVARTNGDGSLHRVGRAELIERSTDGGYKVITRELTIPQKSIVVLKIVLN